MKIVLFDIDETLLICKGYANSKGSEKMFREVFNLEANEDLISHIGKTEKGIIEDVIRAVKKIDPTKEIEVPNEAYKVWAEGTGELLAKEPPIVLPGIKSLLQSLSQDKNILIGLLTGNSRFRSEVKLKTAGLENFFQNKAGVLAGAFGDISNKRSDLIEEAKQKYGEGTYIIIDDSIIAGEMIKKNNIPAILVATGNASVEELKEYSEYVFEDFGDNRWQEALKIIKFIPS